MYTLTLDAEYGEQIDAYYPHYPCLSETDTLRYRKIYGDICTAWHRKTQVLKNIKILLQLKHSRRMGARRDFAVYRLAQSPEFLGIDDIAHIAGLKVSAVQAIIGRVFRYLCEGDADCAVRKAFSFEG